VFLEEVTISNVGLFRHQQTIPLAASSTARPVILIGGLNGSGKTTLLDSIQLALYGKRASLSNRGSLSYEEYLRRSKNNSTNGHEEAFVAVQFRQWSDGEEHTYRVRRAWNVTARGVVERVEVYHNKVLDKFLTETWPEFIEELLPVEIAQLFFFDGEKIEGFADIETSTQLLSRAIHSLLGLNILNRLDADLIAIERRKHTTLKSDIERTQIEELNAEIASLDEKRESLFLERATRQNEYDRKLKGLREAKAHYEKGGGLLFEQRENLESEQQALVQRLKGIEKYLRDCAEGEAPLLLAQHVLSQIHLQAQDEEAATKAQLVGAVLAERDEKLIAIARAKGVKDEVLSSMEDFLDMDRKSREGARAKCATRLLNLSSEATQDLHDLRRVTLTESQKLVSVLLKQVDEIQSRLVEVGRKLASIPAEDHITRLSDQQSVAQAELDSAQTSLAQIDYELTRMNDVRERKHAKLVAQIEQAVEGEFEAENAQRVLSHSRRARETLEQFRIAVVQRHLSRISQLVFDSFRRLLRKESLVTGLTIAPDNFALELRGADGMSLAPDRLSAGERQLLAVSILWGLARASGKSLPVVIDTPLGRLDSPHRGKIVKGYFPYASHQVVLLSTDEEINHKYYDELKPFVSQTYHLEYDDTLGASQVKPGYFW
jgi:DNA sulfur modification protein DndD